MNIDKHSLKKGEKASVDFITETLNAFKKIISETDACSSETGIRRTFEELFLRGVLGYSRTDIKWEKSRADLTILDENNFSVIKIETKKSTENIDKQIFEDQAFKYAEETTRYIGLTNFVKMKVWEIKKTTRDLKVDLDFNVLLRKIKQKEDLDGDEKSQILFLNNLSKEIVFSPSKYDEFNPTYARIDITTERGFEKLLDRLNFTANNLLLGYSLKAFSEYKTGYARYQVELKKTEENAKKTGSREVMQNLAKVTQLLKDKYKKFLPFSGFYLWKQYSGKEDVEDDKLKEVFCKETVYVFLNKLLFLRICEDKNFLEKNISNGGLDQLRKFFSKRFDKDSINKEILELAFKSASGLYSHFYETGILDWFRTGDGEFNELLNRVMWILNQFDFAHVDRDILGNLYEKYLPSEERKNLGEFYTPIEVIDYILTSVGYTYDNAIENSDLLDPSCGSGGFLVRATRRLISRFLMKFGKTYKKELKDPKNWREIISQLTPDEAKIILESIQTHIYGLDINPFACHIAEMNILFQIIDLYQKVREKYAEYTLNRFKIYRTDSLEVESQRQIWDFIHRAYLEEQNEIENIKNRKFDFVVGNPPWGGILKREKGTMLSKRLKKEYFSAIGKYDIYVLFIEKGIRWLKDCGKLGYIVQNRFLRVKYGKKLREFILNNVLIDKIVDFGDTNIFKDATNYPAILILTKNQNRKHALSYIEVKPKADELSPVQIIDMLSKHFSKNEAYFSVQHVRQKKLKNLENWIPVQLFISDMLMKTKNIKQLADVTEEIMQGITFGGKGSDKIYSINIDVIKKFGIEQNFFKKGLKGRDIQKWRLEWDDRYIIYPYDSSGHEIDLKNCPNLERYLLQFYDGLNGRELDGKKISEWGKSWYSFWRVRNSNIFEMKKILCPRLSTESRYALDERDKFYFSDSAVAIVPTDIDIKYLLGLLNSKLLFFIIKNTSPFVQGRYYSYTKTYQDKLPIKIPKSKQEKEIANSIVKKVNYILDLYRKKTLNIDDKLSEVETAELVTFPQVHFSLKDDLSFEKVAMINEKIFLNSKDYITIKNKQLRSFVAIYLRKHQVSLMNNKDAKNVIYTLKIPKSPEILKMIIASNESNNFENEIVRTEREIDELVYKIYGITEKEQKIIEGKDL